MREIKQDLPDGSMNLTHNMNQNLTRAIRTGVIKRIPSAMIQNPEEHFLTTPP
jgi:hypothetical protein